MKITGNVKPHNAVSGDAKPRKQIAGSLQMPKKIHDSVIVDSELSDTSTNPVENRAVKAAMNVALIKKAEVGNPIEFFDGADSVPLLEMSMGMPVEVEEGTPSLESPKRPNAWSEINIMRSITFPDFPDFPIGPVGPGTALVAAVNTADDEDDTENDVSSEGGSITIPIVDENGNAVEIYGGTLDVLTGELNTPWVSVDLASLQWTTELEENGIIALRAELPEYYPDSTSSFFAEHYPYRGAYKPRESTDLGIYRQNSTGNWIRRVHMVLPSGQTPAGLLVYESSSPRTLQLGARQIRTKLGRNYFEPDHGTLSLKYCADATLAYERLLKQIEELQKS